AGMRAARTGAGLAPVVAHGSTDLRVGEEPPGLASHRGHRTYARRWRARTPRLDHGLTPAVMRRSDSLENRRRARGWRAAGNIGLTPDAGGRVRPVWTTDSRP